MKLPNLSQLSYEEYYSYFTSTAKTGILLSCSSIDVKYLENIYWDIIKFQPGTIEWVGRSITFIDSSIALGQELWFHTNDVLDREAFNDGRVGYNFMLHKTVKQSIYYEDSRLSDFGSSLQWLRHNRLEVPTPGEKHKFLAWLDIFDLTPVFSKELENKHINSLMTNPLLEEIFVDLVKKYYLLYGAL